MPTRHRLPATRTALLLLGMMLAALLVAGAAETRAVFDKPIAHIPIYIENEGCGAVDPDGPKINKQRRNPRVA